MKLIHLALIFTVLVQEQKLLCEGFKGFEIHNLVFLAQINKSYMPKFSNIGEKSRHCVYNQYNIRILGINKLTIRST